MRGGVDGEAAPPAADVEHPLALLEGQLGADEPQLGLLGLLEGLRAALEVGAAVGHRGVQEQREERVARVVVVGDRAPVASQRVALPGEPELGGGRARWLDQPAGADERETQPGHLGRRDARRLERVHHAQRLLDVVGLDQPQHVGAAQPQLAGGADDVGQRLGRAEAEGGRVGVGGRHLGAVPEAQGEGALRERGDELAAQRCGVGERQGRGTLVHAVGAAAWPDQGPEPGPARPLSPAGRRACGRAGTGRPARRPRPGPSSPACG